MGYLILTHTHILNAHIHAYIYMCLQLYFIHAYAYIVQDACLVGFNESKVEARTPVGFESKAEKSRLSWNAIYREFFSRRSAHVLATSCGRSNPKVYVKFDV